MSWFHVLLLLYGLDSKIFVASQDSEHSKSILFKNILKLDGSANITEHTKPNILMAVNRLIY